MNWSSLPSFCASFSVIMVESFPEFGVVGGEILLGLLNNLDNPFFAFRLQLLVSYETLDTV